ncbi:MAG: M20 family metallopeptidase [Pirellulaceae bacterium]|nr:M20 family metallopeptidase [Pirellulaceae bacterium]
MIEQRQVERVQEYVLSQQPEIERLLGELVLAESPSDDPASQRPVLKLLTEGLRDCEFRVRHVHGRSTGGYLVARPLARQRGRGNQLLIGHCDTVWPHDTLRQMPLVTGEGLMRGPGVYDMKCGLVQIVFALRTLHHLRLEPPLTPIVLVNSDEEIGSYESLPRIGQLARVARRAFILEPSLGPAGRLKTARKGVGHFTVRIRGRAAHAGLDPAAGASAILELSHVIQQLFALNDPDRGTTVNVGVIDGGLRANVIAPESSAQVDVRVLSSDEGQRVEQAIRSLRPTTPNVRIEVEGSIDRPPMIKTPANERLWLQARELGRQLGMELEEATAGGGSDGNYTSQYTATLDGLGAVGDGAHASHEFVQLAAIPRRTALLALLLLADLPR